MVRPHSEYVHADYLKPELHVDSHPKPDFAPFLAKVTFADYICVDSTMRSLGVCSNLLHRSTASTLGHVHVASPSADELGQRLLSSGPLQ